MMLYFNVEQWQKKTVAVQLVVKTTNQCFPLDLFTCWLTDASVKTSAVSILSLCYLCTWETDDNQIWIQVQMCSLGIKTCCWSLLFIVGSCDQSYLQITHSSPHTCGHMQPVFTGRTYRKRNRSSSKWTHCWKKTYKDVFLRWKRRLWN